jgi:hypothetical protein
MQRVDFKEGILNAPIEQVRIGGVPDGDSPVVASITCDEDGNIVGDTSQLPAHILEQLQTPAAKESIRKQYKASRQGEPELPNPKPRYINEGRQVNYTHLKPAHMSSKEFRKYRRQQFRAWNKAAVKVQNAAKYS